MTGEKDIFCGCHAWKVEGTDQAQAALLAYQSDAGDFADVMRAYIDDLNTRLEHTRLQVERAQSFAVLASLGGF